uniref:non-specific serine/threonine protein kinase n=1 Tax=Oryza punctata TaxID=4537 RepID=A0A0E0M6V5_ORYPU
MGVRMAAVSLACQCILLVTTCLFVSGPDMGGSTSDRPQNLRSTLFEPHGGVTTNRRLLQDTSTSGNDNSSSSSPFPGDTPPDQNTRFIPSYPSPNSNNTAESNPTAKNVAIICSVNGVLIILVVLVYCFVRFRGRRQNGKLPVPGKVKNGVVSLPPSTSGNWQGKKIAVKRLKEVLDISAEDFEREIGILMKVKHRNLVKLVAYCNDDRYRYLCFEYLSGGSLDKLLYASKHNEGSILLDWSRRYHIIKEVCTGLYYLHEESDSEEKILHMDLKAGNVLIDQKSDGNLVVKIADFGTSRLLKADKKHDYITGQLIGPRVVAH